MRTVHDEGSDGEEEAEITLVDQFRAGDLTYQLMRSDCYRRGCCGTIFELWEISAGGCMIRVRGQCRECDDEFFEDFREDVNRGE
jgi:Lon protease-like protein